MTEPTRMNDFRWLTTVLAVLAEGVLIVVTIGIITAMWLPAYLTSRQAPAASDRGRDEMMGMFPRGR